MHPAHVGGMPTQRPFRSSWLLLLLAAYSCSAEAPALTDLKPEASATAKPRATTALTATPSPSVTAVPEGECVTRATGGIGDDFVKTNGVVCDPAGFPFVRNASALSVGPAEVLLRQPEAGTLCVTGTASTTDLAWGVLGLAFSTKNLEETQVYSTFDAAALGIAKLAFTLESAPALGLKVDTASTTQLSCPASPGDCMTPDEGFLLMTGPGSTTVLSITEDGDYVAPLANFQQKRSDGSRFDPSKLEHFSFRAIGDFDFCIRNFRLLDADDQAVAPQPE
jgi:hypothetical protein